MGTVSKNAAANRKPPPGGSRKGVPNKITAAVKDMILEALDGVGGAQYLQEQAQKNPAAFLTLLGKVLPLQLTGEGGSPVVLQVISGVERAPDDAHGGSQH